MVRRLNAYVAVEGRWYPAGATDDQVGDAASRIGDHAWEEVESGAASAAPAPPTPEPVDVVEDETPDGDELVDADNTPAVEPAEQSVKDGDEPPPQSGPGSSERKWRDYAGKHGVDVSDAKDRAGVIALVEAAGKPV